ncbi:MAG: hypothetical protein FWD57_10485 [Polyangiaceae bacterium]|nr:hypothetical protein [Polyangiaceae bacterium]
MAGEANGFRKGEAKGRREGLVEGEAKGLRKGEAKGRKEGLVEGEAKGLKKGEAKGRKDGARILLIDALEERFPSLPPMARHAVKRAGYAEIKVWMSRLRTAETLDDVFAQ